MRLNKRGQSLVEFALIIPVLLALFFAIIDGAFIIQGLLASNHAAREAARFAVTYQPVQGTCLEYSIDGVVDNGYPWCPQNKNESDDEYYTRRVAIIKRIALDRARGLRISEFCETDTCIADANETPGLYGVRVWGFQSFEGDLEQNRPGLPGLPVRVQVIHNVPLVTLAMLVRDPYVQVDGAVEMINEGVQAGIGGAPPPVGGPIPPVVPPEDPPDPVDPPDPDDPSPEDPPSSESAEVTLNFETALNNLPSEREHLVIAHVTLDGKNLAGEAVRFSTDNGSFDFSGSESAQVKTVATNGEGKAQVYLYANEPMVATIEAWADVNKNAVKETTELDTATKTWKASGPYLVVSNHNPEAGDIIGARMFNHVPTSNPHSLWWCLAPDAPADTTPIQKQLVAGISVDAAGYYEATDIEVPLDALGMYRIESHRGAGGCGVGDSLVAHSADIIIKEIPPDLTITDVIILAPPEKERAPGMMMTLTVEIANLQAVPVTTGPFDVDVYPNLDEAPYLMQLSADKQWVDTLGPNETTVMTYSVEIAGIGINRLWVQIDTTNYVEESDETNNVFGPVKFETCPGSDDFNDGLGDFWSVAEIGDADGSHWVSDNGELVIRNKGSSLWSGAQNLYYIYQAIPDGNVFDARLRLIAKPTINEWSKIGLHVRQKNTTYSDYVMNMITNNLVPAGVQIGHNGTRIVDDKPTSLPYWARIVRQGNTYQFYEATVADPKETDWVFVGSTTENTAMPNIGVAHANYNTGTAGDGAVDDFIICPFVIEDETATTNIKPPGLVECEELIHVPGFEGNRDTVFTYWRARDTVQTSIEQYRGNFSMRLMASLGSYPCLENSLDPYLYQDIQLPTTVYSISSLIVNGHYLIDGSDLPCSTPGNPDPADKLTLALQGTDDSVIVPAKTVATGANYTYTLDIHGEKDPKWQTIPITLSDSINLKIYEGQTVRIYWDAYHNDNFEGTFFYVDDVSAQVCTMWPIPEDEPGTVSLGGTLTTKAASSNIRVPLPGADVWAYTQSGETYHTVSIHDGSYHFYNLSLPGTYIVYAEAVVDGQLRTAVTSVTLNLGDRNYGVNLLLQ